MNYFRGLEIFSDLSEADQNNLSDFCQLQTLHPGETLFRDGDQAQALYIIIEGSLEVYRMYDGGEKKFTLSEGALVGEMAFFSPDTQRNATVIAHGTVTLITILHFSMKMMMEKYPELHKKVETIVKNRSE